MPSGTNGSWKRALLAAYTRSQCSSMVQPMPTAGPPTAATTGLLRFGMTSKRRQVGEPAPEGGRCRKSATSFPEVKQSAEPCSSTAPASGSASAAASASASCRYISAVIAFFLSRRSKRTRATRPAVSLLIKAEILELLAQRELGELAGGRVRQLFHEHHVVGHPPLGDLALVEPEQLVLRHLLAGALHRHHDRALVPFRVLHADHRGLGDRRVLDGDVLQVDGADPFAARLDHVLGAVGDLHVAVGVDGGHVAGREPALAQHLAAFALEVAAGDPRPAHHQVAEALAVPRQLAALFVDDLHLDAEDAAALLRLDGELRLRVELGLPGLERADRAQGTHLGHAPGMEHAHAVVLLEAADHGSGAGRPADDGAVERGEPELVLG